VLVETLFLSLILYIWFELFDSKLLNFTAMKLIEKPLEQGHSFTRAVFQTYKGGGNWPTGKI